MTAIQFTTVIDADQVIRPPSGVTLPEGEMEVTVRPKKAAPGLESVQSPHPQDWLLALAADAKQAAPVLPSDMAEHHDHYAHGKPLP